MDRNAIAKGLVPGRRTWARSGARRGPNLLVDGNCRAPTTAAWSAYASATLSKVLDVPLGFVVLRIGYTAAAGGFAFQTGIGPTNSTYRVQGYARGDGTSAPKVTTLSTPIWTGTTSTAWQNFDVEVAIASDSGFYCGSANLAPGTHVEFRDLYYELISTP